MLMKRSLSLLLAPFLLVSGACTDIFDVEPLDKISGDLVFREESLARAVLTDLYANYPFNGWSFINIADESHADGGAVQQGGVSRTNDALPYWSQGTWTYVRDINSFIENIRNAEISAASKTRMEAEARVLRAGVYFEKQKRYGGVPLIDVALDPFGEVDEKYLKRSTEEAVADFIDSELAQAIEMLPDDHTRTGQVNKWTAYAIKARANLWAASIAKYGSVQLGGVVGIPASRADEFYTKAAAASDAVISSGRYALYNAFADRAENYRNIFIDDGNSEVILEQIFDGANRGGQFSMFNVPPRFSLGQGAQNSPLLDFFLGFENIDGSTDQPAFGPDHLYADGLEPWAKKDPRLRAMLFLQGEPYAGTTIQTYEALDPTTGGVDPGSLLTNNRDTYSSGGGPVVDQVGPDSRLSDNHFNTDTGFLLKKFTLGPFTERGREDNNWKAIRLAEMYLTKAEAEFELGNPGAAATALNATRERAGISLVDETSITREHIRNERKVELAYEGHRYWDLRRWRIAEEVLNRSEPFQGLRIVQHYETGKYYFLPMAAETYTRNFRPEHYYNPITDSRREANPLLVENPGY